MRERIDLRSPLARELRERIIGEAFVTEGTMVAFPLCFPGASAPPPPDESHITALDIAPDGTVYIGTSGRRVHLLVGAFHGATGAVFDMGVVDGAERCAAIGCGKSGFIACVNSPDGGRIIRGKLYRMPHDLIQEWGFRREPFEDLGEAVEGEKIVHAVTDEQRERMVVLTEGHLAVVDIGSGKVEVVGEIAGSGRLAVGSRGGIFGLDEGGSLWRYDPREGKLFRRAVELPDGSWGRFPLMWARNPADGRLYTADDEGRLFSFSEEEGKFSPPLGRVPLRPVGPMAVTLDGRLFGMCGEGMANLFCYDPATGELRRLGVPVSVIERRRYGYVFGDAAVGRDGQIFFGEDDELGHLWIYFPRIQPRQARC